MEKIKQALERARAEQRPPSETHQTKDSVLSPKGSLVQAGATAVDEITYAQTKVYSLDSEVLKRNNIVIGTGTHPGAETAYKILRTQVEQRLAARDWNAIAVTSPGAGAGKTSTAINLSMALAQEVHRTVLLADLDFRNPNVHKRFGCEIDLGLVDYLLDDVPLSEILINPGVERLVLLPAGKRAVPNSSELLSSPKMSLLVEELKARYPSRIIVFDLPPLLWSDDTLAFSPYVDTTLLVVAEGLTTKDELTRAVEVLQGTNVLGTVLNKSLETQSSYYT